MRHSLAEMKVETKLVADRLRKLAVDEMVTYDELSEIIATDVRKANVIGTARNQLARDGIHIETVWGQGLARHEGGKVVAAANGDIGKIHRATRRAKKKLTCVGDISKLNSAECVQYNTTLTIACALESMTTNKAQKLVESRVQESQMVLPLAKTLEMFK